MLTGDFLKNALEELCGVLGVSHVSQEAGTIVRLSTRELVPWAGLHLSLTRGGHCFGLDELRSPGVLRPWVTFTLLAC